MKNFPKYSLLHPTSFNMSDCSICCFTFNKSDRSKITCLHCKLESCSSCNKRYLLDSVQEAHCMSCKKVWAVDFLNASFTQSFLTKEYRANREVVYFKQEETQFPALLPQAEHVRKIDNYEAELKRTEAEIKANDEKEDQLVSAQRALHKRLNKEHETLIHKKRELVYKGCVEVEKKQVVMKCPIGECRGFLDTKFFCGLCNSHVCRDCHVKKDDEQKHECRKDDVATIQELNRSTKPCPKCHTRIYKTDGCDQMFCILCHTPFSWRTGQVETGVIHNPHYFEALRAGNIAHERHQPHQGGCGAMRNVREVQYVLREALQLISPLDGKVRVRLYDEFFYYYQQMVHFRTVLLPQLAEVVDRTEERIKFLTGKLDEKKFKQRLFVHHQSSLRQVEEQQVMTMFVNAGEDVFRVMSVENTQESLIQFQNLWKLTIDALTDINKKYQHKSRVPIVVRPF